MGRAFMPADTIFPDSSDLSRTLLHAAQTRRCVFFAGLPGVGKSLLLQQLAILAHREGRVVHLLQWDVARGAFETPEILGRYQEVDGVTHAAIRVAVGVWVRRAVSAWHEQYAGAEHLLVGETPLVGNRLIELVQIYEDPAESLLASERTLFLIPAPSREVRAAIEGARAREMESPRHEREAANAPIDVLRALWPELLRAAPTLGLNLPPTTSEYDPDIYLAIYRSLLQHRHCQSMPIDQVLPVHTSPYDLEVVAGELYATPEEVGAAIAEVERRDPGDIENQAAEWFRV